MPRETDGGVAAGAFSKNNVTSLTVEERILLAEAQLLQALPLNALSTFQQACAVLVPRVAFMILTIHVMLLIPTLRFVKVSLGLSIVPFLYIAPVLLCVPFIVYFLWESDLYEFPYITSGLLRFIASDKSRAVRTMSNDEARLLEALQHDDEPALVEQLAYARLVSKIDPDALCREAMALKRRRSGGPALSSVAVPTTTAASSSSSTALSSAAIASISGKPQAQGGSYLDAARRLVDDVAMVQGEGGDDQAVLAELKRLQAEFEEMAKNTGRGGQE